MGDELLDLFHRLQVYSSFLVMLTLQTSFRLVFQGQSDMMYKAFFFFSLYFGVFTAISHGL